MKVDYFSADSRAQFDFGWLRTAHSYSFGSYWDPNRVGFGALRVINDDHVLPGKGFGKHHHSNMEIVTIPLSGTLAHKDSTGHEGQITHGEVQAMSAGKSILHSEMNASNTDPVSFLQIWIETQELGLEPSYNQKSFDEKGRDQKWQLVVAPKKEKANVVKVNQDAWLYLGDFKSNTKTNYKLHNKNNGVVLFVLNGSLYLNKQKLKKRDMIEISETEEFQIEITEDTSILLIEVPL
jgi:redox-sensitive bicupin YhaK (pirin superfamily)